VFSCKRGRLEKSIYRRGGGIVQQQVQFMSHFKRTRLRSTSATGKSLTISDQGCSRQVDGLMTSVSSVHAVTVNFRRDRQRHDWNQQQRTRRRALVLKLTHIFQRVLTHWYQSAPRPLWSRQGPTARNGPAVWR